MRWEEGKGLNRRMVLDDSRLFKREHCQEYVCMAGLKCSCTLIRDFDLKKYTRPEWCGPVFGYSNQPYVAVVTGCRYLSLSL